MRTMPGGRTVRCLAPLMLLLWALLGSAAAIAQDTASLLPVTDAYRLRADAATPGLLKLHWTIAPDYYLYRGRMHITAGNGVTLGAPQFPAGLKHRDPYLGEVETYHHAIDASVPYTLAPGTKRLTIDVQYQGCHEVDPKICYPPHTERLDLAAPAIGGNSAPAVPTATAPPSNSPESLGAALKSMGSARADGNAGALPPEQAFHVDALAQAPRQLLLRWTMPAGYYLYRDQTRLSLPAMAGVKLVPEWPAGTAHHDAHYGDTTVYFDQLELPVDIQGDLGDRRQLTLQVSFQGCQNDGICYPVMTREISVDLGSGVAISGTPLIATAGVASPDAPVGPPSTGLLAALLLALGGGLILNLMPCVLPVLSIKAVSVLESGESRATARRHALYYSAGVIVSFVALGLGILALRASGHALGWGAQLQQPLLVAVLALVMLAVGLSMSGVVQFGASLGNTGAGLASRAGPTGDFFTGVLAVVVASPCTAPFMGGALVYAFTAPMLAALMVFLALGIGLALPFLLIGYVPSLARLLPRPGRWMETLKQVLAFPMYLTAVWLSWVLAKQRGADAVGLLLVAMVLLAMALWCLERSRHRGTVGKIFVLVLAAATVVPMYLLARVPAPVRSSATAPGVVAYSPGRLAALRAAGTPVFVDMTADWCVTCKANEHTVLDTEAFRALLKNTGAVYMQGDWTNVDPVISAFLQQYHSPGVPLYVVFPKHGRPGQQLSTVLTAATVAQALTAAAQ